MTACASLGLSSTLLPGTLWALGKDSPPLTPALIDAASKLAGLTLSTEQIALMVNVLSMQLEAESAASLCAVVALLAVGAEAVVAGVGLAFVAASFALVLFAGDEHGVVGDRFVG